MMKILIFLLCSYCICFSADFGPISKTDLSNVVFELKSYRVANQDPVYITDEPHRIYLSDDIDKLYQKSYFLGEGDTLVHLFVMPSYEGDTQLHAIGLGENLILAKLHDRGFECNRNIFTLWERSGEGICYRKTINEMQSIGIGRINLEEAYAFDEVKFIIVGHDRGGDEDASWEAVWIACYEPESNKWKELVREEWASSVLYSFQELEFNFDTDNFLASFAKRERMYKPKVKERYPQDEDYGPWEIVMDKEIDIKKLIDAK